MLCFQTNTAVSFVLMYFDKSSPNILINLHQTDDYVLPTFTNDYKIDLWKITVPSPIITFFEIATSVTN